MLALPLDPASDEWLLFFRCEEVEEVRWAGRPDQPFEIDANGTRIGPRASFASWHETVHGTSEPWSDADLRMAARLQMALRDHYQQPGGHAAEVYVLRGRRSRVEVQEHRTRLRQVSELLESLVHVSPAETAVLAERISQLEEDLQVLILASGSDRDALANR